MRIQQDRVELEDVRLQGERTQWWLMSERHLSVLRPALFNVKRGLFFDENLHVTKESGTLYNRFECLC